MKKKITLLAGLLILVCTGVIIALLTTPEESVPVEGDGQVGAVHCDADGVDGAHGGFFVPLVGAEGAEIVGAGEEGGGLLHGLALLSGLSQYLGGGLGGLFLGKCVNGDAEGDETGTEYFIHFLLLLN